MNEISVINKNNKLKELTFNPHKWVYQLKTEKEVEQFISMIEKIWPTRIFFTCELLNSNVCFSSYTYFDNHYIEDLLFIKKSDYPNIITTEQFNFLIENQSSIFYIKHLENAASSFNYNNKARAIVFQIKELIEQLAQLNSYLKPDNQKELDSLINAFKTFKNNLQNYQK